MALFKTGDMWSAFSRVDHFLITTNSFIRNDGVLVMGRGMALQATRRYPQLSQEYGRIVKDICGHLGYYGLILGSPHDNVERPIEAEDRQALIDGSIDTTHSLAMVRANEPHDMDRIGLFQVKYHFAHEAQLGLIQRSTDELKDMATRTPHQTFALNYPGIGNGKLSIRDVHPILETLPDNVEIWAYQPIAVLLQRAESGMTSLAV